MSANIVQANRYFDLVLIVNVMFTYEIHEQQNQNVVRQYNRQQIYNNIENI